MAAASLRDGGFVVTHVRISDEKKQRGAALPGLNAYFPATAVALRRANSSTLFLQTATPVAFDKMGRWCDERHVALSYTRSERAEHDLWVGAAGKRSTNHSGERSSSVAYGERRRRLARAGLSLPPSRCGPTSLRRSWAAIRRTSVRHRCEDLGDDAKGSHGLLCVEVPSGGGGGGGGLGRGGGGGGGGGGDGGRGGGRGKSPIGGRGGGGGRGVGGRGGVAARAAALADQIVELRRQRDSGKLSEETHRVVLGSIAANSPPRRTARRTARRAARRAAARRAARRAAGAPPAATGGAPPAAAGRSSWGSAHRGRQGARQADRRSGGRARRLPRRRAPQAEIAAAEAENERLRSELQARLRAKERRLQAAGVEVVVISR